MKRLALFWDRLNCVCAWPFLFVVDLAIAWSGAQSWEDARQYSTGEILKVWNRNTTGSLK